MLDLVLSICFSSLIFVIFKLYAVYKIDTFYAIVTNYIVACIVGLFFYSGEINPSEIGQKTMVFRHFTFRFSFYFSIQSNG